MDLIVFGLRPVCVFAILPPCHDYAVHVDIIRIIIIINILIMEPNLLIS
jgi:hypothetical protein